MCISGRVEYLIRKLRYNKIANTSASLSRTERRYPMRKKVIFRLVGGGIQVEEINHILFVESNGHVQQVHTVDGSMLETRQSLLAMLQTFETLAPGQFVSPGKGYIVNQSAIHIIKSEYIEVKGPNGNIASSRKIISNSSSAKMHKKSKKARISSGSIFVRKSRIENKFSCKKDAKI